MPVFVVDKPLGPSSHDIVARARRLLGTRRVGHAGTLDPLATGVLLLLSEAATKLSPFLTATDKRYLAWVAFGVGTPTLDAEGGIVERASAGHLTSEAVRTALPPFLLMSEQLPPRHSAVQQQGVRSYAAARRGEPLELPPRPVAYRRIELLAFAEDAARLPSTFAPEGGSWVPHPRGRSFERPPPLEDLPTALLELEVAAGTYVRAFARDLGAALGVPAHLAGLVRTRSGAAPLEKAVAVEEIATHPARDPVALLPFASVRLDREGVQRALDGRPLTATWQGRAALVGPDGVLVAVAEEERGRARYLRVWRNAP